LKRDTFVAAVNVLLQSEGTCANRPKIPLLFRPYSGLIPLLFRCYFSRICGVGGKFDDLDKFSQNSLYFSLFLRDDPEI
jgi:hypothetical protein